MDSVILRDESPPDDAIVIIRGGLMAFESVRRSAEVSMELYGFYGMSVFAAEGVTVEALVRSTSELAPQRYRQLRASTAGVLRASGFTLIPTQDRPHFDVVLADLENQTLERLGRCFGEPFPNPTGGGIMGER